MIANVKEFEKKLIDNDLNRKLLAEKMHISPATLTTKLEKPEGDFKTFRDGYYCTNYQDERAGISFHFFGEKLFV